MARRTKTAVTPAKVADKPVGTADAAAEPAASATSDSAVKPLATVIMADLVMRGGGALLRRVVETRLLGHSLDKGKVPKVIKGRTVGQTLLGSAAVRLATRSVPGAILVGGGLLAKALHDRKKAKKG